MRGPQKRNAAGLGSAGGGKESNRQGKHTMPGRSGASAGNPHVYVRKFTVGGLCATLTVCPNGKTSCNWNRRPSKDELDSILPEYLDFKREAMQSLANESGLRILELVQIALDEWMPREYQPKGTP